MTRQRPGVEGRSVSPNERRPHSVYGSGEEPDPRYSLANERTFLAWVRTALTMLAGAVAMHSLGVPDSRWLRTLVVLALVFLGGLVTVLAFLRWARVEQAMRTNSPLPAFRLGLGTTISVVLIASLLAVTLTFSPG